MRRAEILLLVILLVTACHSAALSADAAVRSISLENPSAKGFVVAKSQGSMTIRDGRSIFQVIVTEHTQVVGRRASFAKISIDDIVRIEGPQGADRRIIATRVEVLLTADTLTVVRRTKPESDDSVTLVTW